MRVLGIETSCDETGVAVYDSSAGLLAHHLHSQAAMPAAALIMFFSAMEKVYEPLRWCLTGAAMCGRIWTPRYCNSLFEFGSTITNAQGNRVWLMLLPTH